MSSKKSNNKKLLIVGIPSCLGGNSYGCHKGPDAIRKQLIPKLNKGNIPYKDYGNIKVQTSCIVKDDHAKCLPEIKKTHSNFNKFLLKNSLFKKGCLPTLLGGDHSFNYPFIKASAKKNKLGLIWFDAHGDFNIPYITKSGNIHGMVLAALSGRGLNKKLRQQKPIIKDQNICIYGARDLDPEEKKLLAKTKVTVITSQEIFRKGIKKTLNKAIKAVTQNTDRIHLSFDLDMFDPSIAPGTGTPVKNGLKTRELNQLLKLLAEKTNQIASIDIMELNPEKDKNQKTAELAAKIITTLA